MLDVDKWPKKDIYSLIQSCADAANWNTAISNPCFEVWLHYHFCKEISEDLNTPAKLKKNLHTAVKGGYNRDAFCKMMVTAIKYATHADSDKGHSYPQIRITKVYQLANQLLTFLGKSCLQKHGISFT
ncbi:RloB domain-containing protein [Chitinophaga eiseniae]|uniref:RloB domain-containing protein n=1 Tax=Chitinophaga eiseniae TaxID=634771 RepID=A0A847SE20_9BACT|nr:RloB domain-containing protein [Chitinophaga eiseniae]NLR78013.1 RloB domain-containing protein [Chitinophaga eiseniae]